MPARSLWLSRHFWAPIAVSVFFLAAHTASHPGESATDLPSFSRGSLHAPIRHPTSLVFGPDGRLYVSGDANGGDERSGEPTLIALTLDASGTRVTGSEVIATDLSHALGVAFDPTAPSSPVTIYVSRQDTTATAGFQGVVSKFTAPNFGSA